MGVQEELVRGGKSNKVAARSFRQAREPSTLQIHPVEVGVVEPLLGVGGKVHPFPCLVDRLDAEDWEFPFRQPPDEIAIHVIQVDVIPPVPLRHPHESLALFKL